MHLRGAKREGLSSSSPEPWGVVEPYKKQRRYQRSSSRDALEFLSGKPAELRERDGERHVDDSLSMHGFAFLTAMFQKTTSDNRVEQMRGKSA